MDILIEFVDCAPLRFARKPFEPDAAESGNPLADGVLEPGVPAAGVAAEPGDPGLADISRELQKQI